MSDPFEALLRRRLDALRDADALRVPDGMASADEASAAHARRGDWVDLSSNDYLGLGRGQVSRETLEACAPAPPGALASRLIFGTHPAHEALEHELADWVSHPAALLFSSGYAANVGTLAALAGRGDVVFSDALNHASIIDGCRLSKARVVVVPHRDLAALGAGLAAADDPGHRWVVTESYFSMDGDIPDLLGLAALCREHNASLIVDEAHALGVFGRGGSGLLRATDARADVLIGTLGKAVGAQGAFVAGSPELRTYLWNRARSLVFSTAPSPLLARVTLAQVRRARAADAARTRLHRLCRDVRRALASRHVPLVSDGEGPIVPVLLKDNALALRAAERLQGRGFRTRAIRPPTVPPGTARLRITLNATLDDSQIDNLIDAVAEATLDRCPGS